MANICSYEMKVVGKKENIEEFIKVMKCHYNYTKKEFSYDRHMGARVFDADASDLNKDENDKYNVSIVGSCAWSVYSCMFEGEHTYYNDLKKEYKEYFRSTTLQKESKLLNLDIEVFSEEPGVGFAEHYLIKHGNIEINEENDYGEYYIDHDEYKTKEDMENDLNIKITDYEWENEDYISRGGFVNTKYNI